MNKNIFWLGIKSYFVIYILPLISSLMLRLIISSATIEFYYCSQILIMYIGLIFWTYYLKKKNQIDFGDKDLNKQCTKNYLVIVLLAGIGWQCLLSFTYYIPWFNTSIPNGFTEQSFVKLYNSVPMLLLTSMIMPIIEEFFFRGTIQELFIRYSDVKWGIIFCACLFASCHGKGFLFALILALFIGYIYFKTSNIIYPIIGHISNNLTNIILVKLELVGANKNMSMIICIGAIFLSLAVIVSIRNNVEKR